MKISTLILFLATLQVSAGVYSQDANLNLEFKKGTLADLFEAIEAQSEYRIFYKTDQVDVRQQVTLAEKEGPISVLLADALKGSDIYYKVFNNAN
jgi:hypothetical protein